MDDPEDTHENMPMDTLENGNKNLTDPEDCSLLESPSSSCVSAHTNGHIRSFNHVHPGDGSSRCVMSWSGDPLPCTTPYSADDAGLLVEESTGKKNQIPISNVIRSACTSKHYRQGPYDLTSGTRSRDRVEDPTLMSFSKGSSQMPLDLRDHKLLPAKHYNGASNEISERMIDSYNKNVQTTMLPCKDNRSTIFPSSNFSLFFSKQSSKREGVVFKGLEASMGYNIVEKTQNKDKKDFVSRIEQTPQRSVDKGSHESYCEEISLRDYLKPGFGKVNRDERLHLFTQIVQLVDFAHSLGIALPDLWLSNFKLLQSNKVIYSDSSTQKELLNVINKMNGKRALEQEKGVHSKLCARHQKLEEGIKSVGDQLQFTSRHSSNSKSVNEINVKITQGVDYNEYKAQQRIESYCVTDQLEKKWYACPEELNERGLLSSNIYSLGVLLFELLCSFESSEMHFAAMLDLQNRILPPQFVSEYPWETGFCLWLLHPEPSSRPTTREILQSVLIHGTEDLYSKSVLLSSVDKTDDAEAELLHNFLTSLREQKHKDASALMQNIGSLETDMKEVRHKHVMGTSVSSNMIKATLMRNISQLESAYFYKRSHIQTTEAVSSERSDTDLLTYRDKCFSSSTGNEDLIVGKRPGDRLGDFFQGICKFARYTKIEVRGALKNGDLFNSANVISSLSFDRDEDYIATAGVSKKIKIFEFVSLLSDSVDINYPAVELSNKSKLSCVCWNKYVRNYLASADYDGAVQLWDAYTGQGVSQFIEHEKRAWCVDFSQVDPTKFASGSDDCFVKLWNINEKNSTGTIKNQANVCCVQFSPYSSHLLAFGSADYKIYCYDIRHTRIPWCTLTGHQKAVSHVKFLDSEAIVSASTDNTLKLWDLKNTSLEGLSSNACSMTYTGHTNEKNFVGLAVLNGYIACGSETNEVYAYYRTLPMPITAYKFGCVDPISGDETNDDNGRFVSNVCWMEKSNMIVAANSIGNIKILQML